MISSDEQFQREMHVAMAVRSILEGLVEIADAANTDSAFFRLVQRDLGDLESAQRHLSNLIKLLKRPIRAVS